ncbi:11202_t:CDS:2 [Scutellospora calospora]|uniref:11202_t:CDS:1 n=1 Tax=Scutellospora calospora TaxID=85575 RepID=A0ACA9K5H6_9GLOM|nr:11202_t:CDS:2 [Scutellospora calospora]
MWRVFIVRLDDVFRLETQSLIEFNLTESCSQTISSAINDESLNNCIPMLTLTMSLPTLLNQSSNDQTVMLNTLAQLIKDTCALKPCTPDIIQQLLQTLKSQCYQELVSKNLLITTVYELLKYYDLIRDIICLRDSANKFNSYCMIETLINIGQALKNSSSTSNNVARNRFPINFGKNSTNISNMTIDNDFPTITSTSIPSTGSTISTRVTSSPTYSRSIETSKATSIATILTTTITNSAISSPTSNPISKSTLNTACSPDTSLLPMMTPLLTLSSQVICTDCNKAIFTKILLYTQNNPSDFNCTPFEPILSLTPKFFSQKCDSQFLDQTIPNDISNAYSILNYINTFRFLGIGCLVTLIPLVL